MKKAIDVFTFRTRSNRTKRWSPRTMILTFGRPGARTMRTDVLLDMRDARHLHRLLGRELATKRRRGGKP